MMRSTSRSVKFDSVASMKGSSSMSDSMMTMIFGTKVSVISWIWVSAWKSETTRPMPSARSITGAPSLSETMIASRAMSMASPGFIAAAAPLATDQIGMRRIS